MSGDWAIEGMEPRAQSVTSEWSIIDQPPIEGVLLRDIRSVPTSYGHLGEIWRADWKVDGGGVDQVFASVIEPGAVSAWHAHGETTDRLNVAAGQLLIVLYDARRSSPSHGTINTWRLGAVRRGLLVVPPGVWHGVKNESGSPGVLVNAVDQAYAYEGPDHWSLPADSPLIPYRLT
jgi:dTDP-4-dehydrorhamnose 3,5-epimerase